MELIKANLYVDGIINYPYIENENIADNLISNVVKKKCINNLIYY